MVFLHDAVSGSFFFFFDAEVKYIVNLIPCDSGDNNSSSVPNSMLLKYHLHLSVVSIFYLKFRNICIFSTVNLQ